jgi:hypothetical protein
MEEEKHLMDETNENMEKDKIIDNGNIISWYKCHFNCSGELLLKKMRGKGRGSFNRQNFRDVLN